MPSAIRPLAATSSRPIRASEGRSARPAAIRRAQREQRGDEHRAGAGAGGEQRPERVDVLDGEVDADVEAAEAERRDRGQAEGTARLRAAAPGRRPGREDDADQGRRHPDDLERRGALAGRHPDDHGQQRGATRRDRRDDAHRPDREGLVEGGDRDELADAGDERRGQVGERRRRASRCDHRGRGREAGELADQENRGEGQGAGAQPAEEVGDPPAEGGREAEDYGEHGGVSARRRARAGPAPPPPVRARGAGRRGALRGSRRPAPRRPRRRRARARRRPSRRG